MTSFINGSASISSGEIFSTDGANYECIITEELATFNGLEVGYEINISNPNNEDEIYTLIMILLRIFLKNQKMYFWRNKCSSCYKCIA